MIMTNKIDVARTDLLLGELRLPGVRLVWKDLAATCLLYTSDAADE